MTIEYLNNLEQELSGEISLFSSVKQCTEFKLKYLSVEGVIRGLFKNIKNVENSLKKDVGIKLNELKLHVESLYKEKFEYVNGLENPVVEDDYEILKKLLHKIENGQNGKYIAQNDKIYIVYFNEKEMEQVSKFLYYVYNFEKY